MHGESYKDAEGMGSSGEVDNHRAIFGSILEKHHDYLSMEPTQFGRSIATLDSPEIVSGKYPINELTAQDVQDNYDEFMRAAELRRSAQLKRQRRLDKKSGIPIFEIEDKDGRKNPAPLRVENLDEVPLIQRTRE